MKSLQGRPAPEPTRVMGVVNVTPDSFSDGGRWLSTEAAVAHGLALAEAGADILDIGGESTRPGAEAVSTAEELDRVLPVIEGLRNQTDVAISIDTMKPDVARAAFAAGATVWNDVTALRYAPESIETARTLAAEMGGEIILMHMQGEPRSMQADPRYQDVVSEVIDFLKERAAASGLPAARLWVDPGIGFGKRLEHNLALIRALKRIKAETGVRLAFGASRKRFIGWLDRDAPVARRLGGSLAAALLAAQRGADLVRVHDVAETVQALAVWRAIEPGDERPMLPP